MSGRSIILLVSHSAAGGAQELWMDLASGLTRRGHRVALWAFYPWPDSYCAPLDDLEWNYVLPTRPKSPIGSASLFRTLIAKLRAAAPDVVITALPAANVTAALAVWAAQLPTKVIATHHSPSGTYNPLLNFVDRFAGARSSVSSIVCVSNAVRSSHSGKPAAFRAKLRTITNAIPPRIEQLIARLAKERGVRSARNRTVIAAGRLATQKNYPLLLDASALAPTVRIDIVGDGPQGDELRQQASALGVTDRVTFLGQRSRDETLKLIDGADVFAQVSLFEGHSLALVEAAKLGMPLIVSDAPVQVEGVTASDGSRCGIVVPLNDPSALASAMTSLLDHPEDYSRWASEARRLGEEASFERMVDAYEALLA